MRTRLPSPNDTAPLRIGCAAGFSGDRTDAAGPVVEALIAAGGPAVLIFETLAERTLALAQLARRADPRARLRAAARRAAAPGAGPLPGARHPHRQQLRRRQSARRGTPHRRAGARARPARRRASRWSRATTSARPSGGRCCARRSATPGVDDGCRRWSAPTPTSAPRRSPTRCSPARRSSSCGRVADPSLTVGPALAHFGWRARRLGPAGARHHGRPPARMRRAGQRRLLRRPGLQGRARPGARRLPDRRDRRRRPLHHHQAGRHRRPRSTRTPSRSSCSTRCTTRRPT